MLIIVIVIIIAFALIIHGIMAGIGNSHGYSNLNQTDFVDDDGTPMHRVYTDPDSTNRSGIAYSGDLRYIDGNRFRGRVHMGSGDWRVWKILFNPGKALKRSDGHRGAGEEYTQLRCFGRRPHALYGQTVNLFLASVISPHNSCKLRCQQLRFQRRQPAVSNIFPSCR